MTLILIQGQDVRFYEAKDKEEARYWFERRIEKDDFVADKAFLVNWDAELPVSDWAREYYEKKAKDEKKQRELEERTLFEKLKAKFE